MSRERLEGGRISVGDRGGGHSSLGPAAEAAERERPWRKVVGLRAQVCVQRKARTEERLRPGSRSLGSGCSEVVSQTPSQTVNQTANRKVPVC